MPLQAAAYIDDFEDGSLTGWLSTSSGGVSLFGVQQHNSSNMAYVAQTGAGPFNQSNTTQGSLSQTFAYSAEASLAFDIHATAVAGHGGCCGTVKPAGSGVLISFLNAFNVPVASEAFVYYTDTGYLGTNYYQINSTQLSYNAKMSDFASLAGLNSGTTISKLELTFFAWATFSSGGNVYGDNFGTATVWFDNVSVGQVPEPKISIMMLAGAVALLAFRRRATAAYREQAANPRS